MSSYQREKDRLRARQRLLELMQARGPGFPLPLKQLAPAAAVKPDRAALILEDLAGEGLAREDRRGWRLVG